MSNDKPIAKLNHRPRLAELRKLGGPEGATEGAIATEAATAERAAFGCQPVQPDAMK